MGERETESLSLRSALKDAQTRRNYTRENVLLEMLRLEKKIKNQEKNFFLLCMFHSLIQVFFI